MVKLCGPMVIYGPRTKTSGLWSVIGGAVHQMDLSATQGMAAKHGLDLLEKNSLWSSAAV